MAFSLTPIKNISTITAAYNSIVNLMVLFLQCEKHLFAGFLFAGAFALTPFDQQ